MYTFSNKLRIGSFIAMGLGFIFLAIGFLSAPSTVEEAKAMVAVHDDGHGGGHAEEATDHGEEQGHAAEASHGAEHDASHDTHLLHKLQNRPWSALYVAAFFFFMISLGVLAFYAIQRASQAGWSPLLFRVMEGITAYLVPGGIIVFVILLLSTLHMNHMFVWMDAETVAHDKLLQGKAGYLNPTFFLIRAAIFLGGWIFYRQYSRKLSLAQDESDDNTNFVRNFRWSAGFLVFYLITESMMSWDWIMSVDPHWFSTLFGWYVFASMFVSGITVIAMVTVYLKSKGYLEQVNDSHIHDLANFIFPLLVLMNSDYKRINWFVIMTGIVVLFGHYLDIFNMIMPATVGDQWYIGLPEIGGILFFGGLFVYWVFTALTKAPLQPKRNPFIEESRHFHY